MNQHSYPEDPNMQDALNAVRFSMSRLDECIEEVTEQKSQTPYHLLREMQALIILLYKYSQVMHHFFDQFQTTEERLEFIEKMKNSIERASQVVTETYKRPHGVTLH